MRKKREPVLAHTIFDRDIVSKECLGY